MNVDFHVAPETVRPLLDNEARMLLLYDAGCPVCRTSVRFLASRKGAERLRMTPLQEHGVLERLGISHEAAMGALHAVTVDGAGYVGADGVIRALAVLPRYRWVGGILRVPGAMPVARMGYNVFARLRPRDECESGVCRRHG